MQPADILARQWKGKIRVSETLYPVQYFQPSTALLGQTHSHNRIAYFVYHCFLLGYAKNRTWSKEALANWEYLQSAQNHGTYCNVADWSERPCHFFAPFPSQCVFVARCMSRIFIKLLALEFFALSLSCVLNVVLQSIYHLSSYWAIVCVCVCVNTDQAPVQSNRLRPDFFLFLCFFFLLLVDIRLLYCRLILYLSTESTWNNDHF